jgi:riboflavin kinase
VRVTGVVVAGVGEGARFVAIDWVRAAVRAAAGFDPYPGTLNVRLPDAAARAAWRALRGAGGTRLTPPDPPACGGWLLPVRIEGAVDGAVVVPDVTRHGEDILEVLAPVHLRSHLGRGDGQPVTLEALAGGIARR